MLNPLEDEAYFRAKPKHRAYWPKAAKMRQSAMDEVRKLARNAN
jgi:hypothetical protein